MCAACARGVAGRLVEPKGRPLPGRRAAADARGGEGLRPRRACLRVRDMLHPARAGTRTPRDRTNGTRDPTASCVTPRVPV
eukprot:6813495-Prymnesium_polylepis.1